MRSRARRLDPRAGVCPQPPTKDRSLPGPLLRSDGAERNAGPGRTGRARLPIVPKNVDPYALLGVPRDASDDEIRRAYEKEINRAHRDGATRHAVEVSQAFDTLSQPHRRAAYDRHGIAPVRERSPGAAPPPRSWRQEAASYRPEPRRRRRPLLRAFALLWRFGPALVVASVVLNVPPASRDVAVHLSSELGQRFAHAITPTAPATR